MNRAKRIISVFLAVVCLLTLLIPAASAVNSGKKLIALTFDDGPGKDTPRLLNALRERGVHCTFFIIGRYAKLYPQTVKQCYEDGHQIANHSYNHPRFSELTDEQIRAELQSTANAIDSAIGAKNTYMCRPPYGNYNERVLKVIGAPTFYWSDDSSDWKSTSADTVYTNVVNGAEDGDILLLHDSHSWSVTAAISVVDTLLARGYEFVTLSELFRRRGQTLQSGNIYRCLRDTGICLPEISKPAIRTENTPQGTLVTLSNNDGTKIHYTTDGTVPNAQSPVYSKPFYLHKTATVTAVSGYDMNGSRSTVMRQKVAVATFDAPKIDIDADGTVTLSAPDGVGIYYTTDSTTPTPASAQYTQPFTVGKGSDVSAIAFTSGMNRTASEPVMLRYTECGNVFSDLPADAWYYADADFAAANGLMRGTDTYVFSPSRTLTRAMLVTMLYRLAGGGVTKNAPAFADVEAGEWYTDAVAWAVENRIVNGYSSTRFGPNDPVIREQAAAILYRYANNSGAVVAADGNLTQFSDAVSISTYAADALSWAVGARILNGVGNNRISPKGQATRAQIAAIMHRFLNIIPTEQETISDEALLLRANEVLSVMQAGEFTKLAEYVHPKKGVTFSPFSTVNIGQNTMEADDFKNISSDLNIWGVWDGSDEPISMNFVKYWERFVWNADYTQADHVNANMIYQQGNAAENVVQAYPNCKFVEYHVDSVCGEDNAIDWSALKLVFQAYESQWYLVAIIHSEWTT